MLSEYMAPSLTVCLYAYVYMLIHIVVLKHSREENSPVKDLDKIMTRRYK